MKHADPEARRAYLRGYLLAAADALVKSKNCNCVAARIPLGRDGRCIEMWRPHVKERNQEERTMSKSIRETDMRQVFDTDYRRKK